MANFALRCVTLIGSLACVATAHAYSIACSSSDSCVVTCDNGQRAGTMYWNGSRWSDGVRSHTDRDELAKQIVKAQGTACR